MLNNKYLHPFWIVLALIVVGFSVLKMGVVAEQDVFWQIRAGGDLLAGKGFPVVDEWSYSGKGYPWFNIQWVSTVLLYSFFKLFGVPGIAVLRGLLVGLLLFLLGLMIRVLAKRRVILLMSLLPLAFIAIWFRLEVRSDTFNFLTYALLVLLWISSTSKNYKVFGTLFLVLLSANLHAGTAPFLVLTAISFLLGSIEKKDEIKQGLIYCALVVLVFFLTPYHVRVLQILFEHYYYYKFNIMNNPDHQPLSMHHLSIESFGFAGLVWIFLTTLVFLLMTISFLKGKSFEAEFAPGYRVFSSLPLVLLLTYMCTNRIRSFPYQVIYCFPILIYQLNLYWDRILEKFSLLNETTLLFTMVLVYQHSVTKLGLPDLKLSKKMFPIGSVEFIRNNKPEANIYHTYAYGAYMVWFLKEYPLFVDTRESPFRHLQQKILNAYYSPEDSKKLFQEFGVNTLLLPIPKTRLLQTGFIDLIARYTPESEWALVYFDDISIVVLRRTAKNESLIQKFEYKLLRPNLPPSYYVQMKKKDIHSKKQLEYLNQQYSAELNRCRVLEPENLFCAVSNSSWKRLNGTEEEMKQMMGDLEKLRESIANKNDIYLLTELQMLYQKFGLMNKLSTVNSLLGPGQVVNLKNAD